MSSLVALQLLERAKERDIPLSVRQAAKLAGVSHSAVLRMQKRRNKRLGYVGRNREEKIQQLKRLFLVENLVVCKHCKKTTDHTMRMEKGILLFTCKTCGLQASEKHVHLV
jgi:Domain found in IF2B/IF5